MNKFGYVRVASCTPELSVADCRFNAERTLDLLRQAEDEGVVLAAFPEMGLTGYTCHDLFHDTTLQRSALMALEVLLNASEMCFSGVAIVGMPVLVESRLFNAAVVFNRGKILGIVPKTFLPNYKEFYDSRYFAPASSSVTDKVRIVGQDVPFGTDILFHWTNDERLSIAVEICEDLWTPIPPSSRHALAGATVLVNLSASNETIGKAAYRKQLVATQSARCLAGYVYASSGVGESTTDLVFGGHGIIAENGQILTESRRYSREAQYIVADIDVDRLIHERVVTNSFHAITAGNQQATVYRRIPFVLNQGEESPRTVRRHVDPHPFVPSDPTTLSDRCNDIFHIQVAGLAKRLSHIGCPPVYIGISGGLDSTLALLVACKTMDQLGTSRDRIHGITMPGFGTTSRTRSNALSLMAGLGISSSEIDIRQLVFDEMMALNHSPFGISLDGLNVESLTEKLRQLKADERGDLVFENTQARTRTSLLMNSGFVIGTGDLSELALGWCTYNADHMSMYNPNVGIPKTLVKFLVRWAAENEFSGSVRATLLDVVATIISPELLPISHDGEAQSTESTVGPYELHDFFLHQFLRFGTTPEKILFLAKQAQFDRNYSTDELRKWLSVFFKRFFTNQFKRSCLPDGPKVGSITLSPRGDWRMPSDAVARAWLEAIERWQ